MEPRNDPDSKTDMEMCRQPEGPQPHCYAGLSTGMQDIRVLDVAPGKFDDMIECAVRTISLAQRPALCYETISYCWGTQGDLSSIRLDNSLARVPASSVAAIRRMRLPHQTRTLWIDAICINQQDNVEKSEQVTMMSSIYCLGTQNLVYLGEDEEWIAERAVGAVQSVMSDMREATNNIDPATVRRTLWREEAKSVFANYSRKPFMFDIDFNALVELFKRPWFRRLWVLQEVSLAPSNSCYWGDSQFELLNITRTANWLDFKHQVVPGNLQEGAGFNCALRMNDILDPSGGLWASGVGQLTYSDLLDLSSRFEKSEPRDGVFATLGLLGKQKEAHSHLLRVDYTRPLAEVLQDATRYALCECNDLELFRTGPGKQQLTGADGDLPTWVVGTAVATQTWVAPFDPAYHGLGVTTTMLADISAGPDVLLTEGFVIDRVADASKACVDSNFIPGPTLRSWLAAAKRVWCAALASQEGLLAVYEQMACAVTAGFKSHGQRPSLDDRLALAEYLRDLCACEECITAETNHLEDDCDFVRFVAMEAIFRFELMVGRCFLKTTAGRPGLGPATMQAGDIIVVLRGGWAPFVLREADRGFQFIGPVYFDGINEEAVAAHRAAGAIETVFPLI